MGPLPFALEKYFQHCFQDLHWVNPDASLDLGLNEACCANIPIMSKDTHNTQHALKIHMKTYMFLPVLKIHASHPLLLSFWNGQYCALLLFLDLSPWPRVLFIEVFPKVLWQYLSKSLGEAIAGADSCSLHILLENRSKVGVLGSWLELIKLFQEEEKQNTWRAIRAALQILHWEGRLVTSRLLFWISLGWWLLTVVR